MTETKPPRPDRTIAIDARDPRPDQAPSIRVAWVGAADAPPAEFAADFRLGRGEECDVRVDGAPVSRVHAEVTWHDGDWWLADLDSRNGTFLDGNRIGKAVLKGTCRVQLGVDGPRLVLSIAGPEGGDTAPEQTTSFYLNHYLEGVGDEQVGDRTMMIRRAYQEVSRRRRRFWLGVVAVFALLLAAAGGYGWLQHRQLARQQALAEQVFYDTKALELQLASLEDRLGESGEAADAEALAAGRDQLESLRGSYHRMIEELGLYSDDVPEEERLIRRIAGVLGESEVGMPPEFAAEVQRYIERWRRDTRFAKAIRRSLDNGYGPRVAAAMLEVHLPPQFFYVALQESDLRTDVCGPETRYGIAKGPWQFIPATARAYGLKTGPLYLLRKADPKDDRHDFDKATAAAARYLRDLYTKQAQASGLLVIASYNWGETNVRRVISRMPENPRERNFWRLFTDHRSSIPRETYGYVFRIFAAAVIGENPQLFGFDFPDPLAPTDDGTAPPAT